MPRNRRPGRKPPLRFRVPATSPVPGGARIALADGLKQFNSSYRAHRDRFVAVSDYSEKVRRNRIVTLVGFLVFAFLTLPKNARGVRAFYREMMASSPLPDFPGGGITEQHIQQARKVLFFYLLFLLYQLVQFPLTFGRDNIVQFSADLAFQTSILVALIWSFQRLKRQLNNVWRGDPSRREKMNHWLNERLDGLNIRWRDIRRLALGIFVTGFAPVTLAHLTGWLDALAAFNERFIGA